ncbi:uracil-DNA glycosylase family protein [Algimonas porphyrae]|uniref:Type-4 uracil-DNA glycosylase n=1 Tax=Algimonas porphyrae TaxID=1128113 RepID=A0ABQ5UZ90_9PROT|nr:uracil-DNA glycosylase [Algimonas porphyrae]GLQ19686.1 uracil-DNA glycosylase [Algimonas porphyrae]
METSLRSLLDWYERVGVEAPDLPLARSVRRIRPKPAPESVPARAPTSPKSDVADPGPIAAACKTLADLKTALDQFDAGPLSDGARQAVLSRGNPESDLMIIGEAPGRDEDMAGKPFVGRSGQLLDRMLGAIGLKSGEGDTDDVYVGNVCFWRPPNNRKPDPAELELCRPFVNRHIQLAKPKLILLTGGTAMQVMTGVTGIMKNRGQWMSVNVGTSDIPVLPIYHPAFLLRQPALKAEAWQDLLTLREALAAL